MVAAMFDRVEGIDLLVRHGADPAHRDASGLSAALEMGAERTPSLLRRLALPG